jgi:hypothetical protein
MPQALLVLSIRPPQRPVESGAGGGTRTPNHLFTRQVRCQLRHASDAAPAYRASPRRTREFSTASKERRLRRCPAQPVDVATAETRPSRLTASLVQDRSHGSAGGNRCAAGYRRCVAARWRAVCVPPRQQDSGTARPHSDVDVAAWWPAAPPPSFDVLLPAGVDLLVLNNAPLELAGRVALEGVLLFDDDPSERVHWLAQTRKIYFDEKPRIDRSHREFTESLLRGR